MKIARSSSDRRDIRISTLPSDCTATARIHVGTREFLTLRADTLMCLASAKQGLGVALRFKGKVRNTTVRKDLRRFTCLKRVVTQTIMMRSLLILIRSPFRFCGLDDGDEVVDVKEVADRDDWRIEEPGQLCGGGLENLRMGLQKRVSLVEAVLMLDLFVVRRHPGRCHPLVTLDCFLHFRQRVLAQVVGQLGHEKHEIPRGD
jgi:hypothetical protein